MCKKCIQKSPHRRDSLKYPSIVTQRQVLRLYLMSIEHCTLFITILVPWEFYSSVSKEGIPALVYSPWDGLDGIYGSLIEHE